MNIKSLFQNLIHLIYPSLCVGCSEALVADEQFFCSRCLSDLPKTNDFLSEDTQLRKSLPDYFPVQKAASYLYFNDKGLGKRVVVDLKYHGNMALGRWIGTCMANDFCASGFFNGIDYLVPVPLHRWRRWKRGFNQSEVLAGAISAVTGIPVDTHVLYRARNNKSQTKKNVAERRKNVQDLFRVRDIAVFKNKHVLLIDDVLTTGATLKACTQALSLCENVRTSVLTLSIA
jgi:ComF family protein